MIKSKKQGKRNDSKQKQNLLEISSDSSVNLEKDLYFTPRIKNLDNDKLFKKRNKKSKEIISNSSRNPILFSLKQHISNTDENNDMISILKKENTELYRLISLKDKEIQNLKEINTQIIKGQESKNEVYLFKSR